MGNGEWAERARILPIPDFPFSTTRESLVQQGESFPQNWMRARYCRALTEVLPGCVGCVLISYSEKERFSDSMSVCFSSFSCSSTPPR
jgi:hypothetical protein